MSERDPYLDEAMRGWIVNFARNNFWRVQRWYEFEDLVQDGYMCYAKCRKHYAFLANLKHPSAGDRRWFMRLVQTTFTNHIHQLANRRTTHGQDELLTDYMIDVPGANLDHLTPVQPEEATLRLLLASAPREIVELVNLLASEGREVVKFLRNRVQFSDPDQKVRTLRRRERETTNEHYCRRLGLDPKKVDLLGLLKNHLGLT